MGSCRFLNRASAFAVVAFVSLFASAATWFDAGVANYDSWPTNGSNKDVDGMGTWTNTIDTAYEDGRIKMWKDIDGSLDFVLAENLRKDISSDVSEVVSTMRFMTAYEVPAPAQDAKGAICVQAAVDDSVTNYLGLVKDPVDGTNVWAVFTGAVPDETKDCTVKVSSRVESGVTQVRYEIDGNLLTLGGNEWNDVVSTDTAVARIGFVGSGEVAGLAGLADNVEGDVELTIPAVANVSIVSVKVGGEEIEPTDGKYVVPAGSLVTVTFATTSGRLLSDSSRSYYLLQDTTLTPEDMPSTVALSDVLKINEVMASNGETLATKNGGAELDWVELRNDYDADIDVAGWYMYDDATKPNKWVQIEGSCVIPAHGFKIVWCDKSYTNWAADEAHAKFGVGKSDSTVVLATSNSVDDIVAT